MVDVPRPSKDRHSTSPLAQHRLNHYNPGSPSATVRPPMPVRRTIIRLVARIAAAAAYALSFAWPAAADPGAAVLLVVGDSISAGYGLAAGTGWVALLSARIDAERLPYRVVNASVTGDTTAGGRARLPTLLAQHKPAIVVVELGGNDGLRGGSLKSARDNLDWMVAEIGKAGAKAVLVGMKLPPNYGPAYTREFDAMFGEVAKSRKVPLVPYLFAGFGESNEWFQADRIHPTATAQSMLLDNIWPVLKPLVSKSR